MLMLRRPGIWRILLSGSWLRSCETEWGVPATRTLTQVLGVLDCWHHRTSVSFFGHAEMLDVLSQQDDIGLALLSIDRTL
jgi:hypothetical protein